MDEGNQKLDPDFLLKLKYACYDTSLKVLVGAICFLSEALFLPLIDREVLGIIFVRLELLRQTIIFSRKYFQGEAIHGCNKRDLSNVVNLIWLMLLTISISAFILCFIWLGNWNWLELPSGKHVQDYKFAVISIGICCIMETLAEPAVILSKNWFYQNWRKYVNEIKLCIETIIIIVTVNFFPECTVIATAYGKLVISLVLLIVNWIYFILEFREISKQIMDDKDIGSPLPTIYPFRYSKITDFLPMNIFSTRPLLDRDILMSLLDSLKQGAKAHFGIYNFEKFVMTFYSPLSLVEQGIYYTVATGGERIADCLFHFIEWHSIRFYFPHKKKLMLGKHSDRALQISFGFSKFLRITSLIGCSIVAFGLSYSYPVSLKYAGNLLAEYPGSLLVKAQCFAIFLKGIHGGITSYAKLSLDYRNSFTRLCTYIPPVVSGMLIYQIGSFAFVVGYCCKWCLLILHDLRKILRGTQGSPINELQGLFLSKAETLALWTALGLSFLSKCYIDPLSLKLHIGVGVLSAALVLESIVYSETRGWKQVYSFILQVFFDPTPERTIQPLVLVINSFHVFR